MINASRRRIAPSTAAEETVFAGRAVPPGYRQIDFDARNQWSDPEIHQGGQAK